MEHLAVSIDNAPGYIDHFVGWLIISPSENFEVRNCVVGYEDTATGEVHTAVVPERCVTKL